MLVTIALLMAGPISHMCLARIHQCSALEDALLQGIGFGAIGVSLLCIVQGWRGRLFGCRIRRELGA